MDEYMITIGGDIKVGCILSCACCLDKTLGTKKLSSIGAGKVWSRLAWFLTLYQNPKWICMAPHVWCNQINK